MIFADTPLHPLSIQHTTSTGYNFAKTFILQYIQQGIYLHQILMWLHLKVSLSPSSTKAQNFPIKAPPHLIFNSGCSHGLFEADCYVKKRGIKANFLSS